MDKSGSSGVTLVELMVVVAIVAILSAIAYPSYRSHVTRSHRAEAKAALLDSAQRLEKCYTRRHTYTGCNQVADRDTESGRYFIDIEVAQAGQTFTLTALPHGEQGNDTECGALSINNRDVRGTTGTGKLEKCW